MEIHYTGNGNLSGILGELVGRESGSLGVLGVWAVSCFMFAWGSTDDA